MKKYYYKDVNLGKAKIPLREKISKKEKEKFQEQLKEYETEQTENKLKKINLFLAISYILYFLTVLYYIFKVK